MRADAPGTLKLPVAATTLVLERGVYDPSTDYGFANVFKAIRSRFFANEVADWLASPEEEQFLLYSQRLDGRRESWFLPDRDAIVRTTEMHIREYELRRTFPDVYPFATPDVADKLKERVAEAAIDLNRTAPARTEDFMQGITVYEGNVHGEKLLLVRVAHQLLREQQVHGILWFLDSCAANATSIKKRWMNVRIAFDGFDDDAREIFQIEECRQFIFKIATAAPWFLAFVHPAEYSSWLGSLSKLEDVRKLPDGTVTFRVVEQSETVHPMRTIQLLRCANLTPDNAEVAAMLENLSISLGQFLTGNNMGRMDPISAEMYQHKKL